MTCALAVEATARELERYRRRAAGLVVTGLAVLGAAVGLGVLVPEAAWGDDAAGLSAVVGILCLGGGTGSLVLARRMRRALGAAVWSAHPAVTVGRTGHATTVVLRAADGSETWPLAVVAARHRYEAVRPGPDGVLWWCGDPRAGGVLAPPGGEPLIWAKPLRGTRVRRIVVGQAEARGLLERPVPRRPQAAPAAPERGGPDRMAPDRVRSVAGPTYAVLAEHARRQALPQDRAPRPEADVRGVPWWRVRSLRRVAGLPSVLVALAFCAAVGAVALTGPPAEDAPKLWAAGAVSLAGLLYSAYRALVGGLPAARLMARAAVSAVSVSRRYVLLYDPHGGVPVLLLFPARGGPDDRPEAAVPLLLPGSRKRPRRGLPAVPAGIVELHGRWGFDPAGERLVPWVEGRPLWPAGPYRQADAEGFAALVDRLAPPVEERLSP
ncbi:hypothetical protein [Streptomyces sp. NPDC059491]|uniref:hypothetical protein n=1 Tax=Streptomyces sp. NPDC059491 TaxID=3346850 RepID=UPI0036821078